MKCFIQFVFFPFSLFGQTYFQPSGSTSWGLANSLVSRSYTQCIFDNPAGLGFQKSSAAFLSYNSGFAIPSLAVKAIGINFISKNLHIGLGGQNYGDKLFSESLLNLGAAIANQKFSLGFKLGYQAYSINQDNSRSTLLLGFGGIAKLFPFAHFGFNLSNLFGSNYYKNQALPIVLNLGFNLIPSDKVQITFQSDIIKEQKSVFKAGLSYQVNKLFQARIGLSSLVNRYHLGLGFQKKYFHLGLGVSSDVNIGLRQHFSMAYTFNKE